MPQPKRLLAVAPAGSLRKGQSLDQGAYNAHCEAVPGPHGVHYALHRYAGGAAAVAGVRGVVRAVAPQLHYHRAGPHAVIVRGDVPLVPVACQNLPLAYPGQDQLGIARKPVQRLHHDSLVRPELGPQVGVEAYGYIQGRGPVQQADCGGHGAFRYGGEDARDVQPVYAGEVQPIHVLWGHP